VIKETTHQDLPPNFQTAEFLEDHGLIDLIVHRRKMRETLSRLVRYLKPTP
jgi:acetyl-CoA carboxylase carboxyl transferase subunit beta